MQIPALHPPIAAPLASPMLVVAGITVVLVAVIVMLASSRRWSLATAAALFLAATATILVGVGFDDPVQGTSVPSQIQDQHRRVAEGFGLTDLTVQGEGPLCDPEQARSLATLVTWSGGSGMLESQVLDEHHCKVRVVDSRGWVLSPTRAPASERIP